jgi:Ca2+-binding EF-hand superfamily protein
MGNTDFSRRTVMRLGCALFFCVIVVLTAPAGYCQDQTAQETLGTKSTLPTLDCGLLLDAIDTDGDGIVTLLEWNEFFQSRDLNKDGRITPDEFKREAPQAVDKPEYIKEREALFDKLDADKSGSIARSEWPANDRSFRRLDGDSNGSLNKEEFLSVSGRFWNELFENWDRNGDGLLSRNEWLDTAAAFNRLDRNRNGVLDRFEFYTR